MANSQTIAKKRKWSRQHWPQFNSDRHLSANGDRDNLRHLHLGQHEVTTLHAACFSAAWASACAILAISDGRNTEFLICNDRHHCGMCLDRNCARDPADGSAVFPCVSALS